MPPLFFSRQYTYFDRTVISLTMYLQNSVTFILHQLFLAMGMPDCPQPPFVFDTGDLQAANRGLLLLDACKLLIYFSTLP